MDENGNMVGKTKYAKCDVLQTFNEILNEILSSGRITKVCTIPVKIYWHFWLFPCFSKFEVLARSRFLVIGNLRG